MLRGRQKELGVGREIDTWQGYSRNILEREVNKRPENERESILGRSYSHDIATEKK